MGNLLLSCTTGSQTQVSYLQVARPLPLHFHGKTIFSFFEGFFGCVLSKCSATELHPNPSQSFWSCISLLQMVVCPVPFHFSPSAGLPVSLLFQLVCRGPLEGQASSFVSALEVTFQPCLRAPTRPLPLPSV